MKSQTQIYYLILSNSMSQQGTPPFFPVDGNVFGTNSFGLPTNRQGGLNLTWIVGTVFFIILFLWLINSYGLTKKAKKSTKPQYKY